MKHIHKYKLELILAIALLVGIAAGAAAGESTDWQDHLIRLHVVANSDSAADQAEKLEVRDAILTETEAILNGASNAAEARNLLTEALPRLECAANQALAGTGRTASVNLQRETFPLREYGTFRLPAGKYEALRVTIGNGEGQNWWCVVYPSLCLAATADEVTELAVAAGLSEEEAALLTGQQDGYVFRFQIVELWHRLINWLRSL